MAKNITKRDLILNISDGTGIPQAHVLKIADAFLDTIKFHLMRGDTIELRGFGTFTHVHRRARKARVVRTGKAMVLPDRIVPILRFSPAFRKAATIKPVPEE